MEIINVLQQQYLFDIWVFSQWWMYTPLLIPAMFYFAFFVVKWAVLTLPIWCPIVTIVKAMKTKTIIYVKEDKEKE